MDPFLTFLQSFVQEAGHNYSAPFWMGEFGTNTDSDNWRKMVRFLKEHDLDWAYWPLDGYQYRETKGDESFGILTPDFASVRHDWKLQQLQDIMPILRD